jgi:hypothetical protein
MYRESIPTTDRLELDRTLWFEWPPEPLRSASDWSDICRSLGHVALDATSIRTPSRTTGDQYFRGNDRLSADDIRELESYFDFLRRHYGIPEGATVFPKRDAEPAPPTDPENDDAS